MLWSALLVSSASAALSSYKVGARATYVVEPGFPSQESFEEKFERDAVITQTSKASGKSLKRLPICKINSSNLCECWQARNVLDLVLIETTNHDAAVICSSGDGRRDAAGKCHVRFTDDTCTVLSDFHSEPSRYELKGHTVHPLYPFGTRHSKGIPIVAGGMKHFLKCENTLEYCDCSVYSTIDEKSQRCFTPGGSRIKIDADTNRCHIATKVINDEIECFPIDDTRPSKGDAKGDLFKEAPIAMPMKSSSLKQVKKEAGIYTFDFPQDVTPISMVEFDGVYAIPLHGDGIIIQDRVGTRYKLECGSPGLKEARGNTLHIDYVEMKKLRLTLKPPGKPKLSAKVGTEIDASDAKIFDKTVIGMRACYIGEPPFSFFKTHSKASPHERSAGQVDPTTSYHSNIDPVTNPFTSTINWFREREQFLVFRVPLSPLGTTIKYRLNLPIHWPTSASCEVDRTARMHLYDNKYTHACGLSDPTAIQQFYHADYCELSIKVWYLNEDYKLRQDMLEIHDLPIPDGICDFIPQKL